MTRNIEIFGKSYSISDTGRLTQKSYTSKQGRKLPERDVKYQKTVGGYYSIIRKDLEGHQRIIYIHRLVASAFLPNPSGLPCVNHKNEDKTDNRLENLEWCNEKYNINYSYARHRRSGIPEKEVLMRDKNGDVLREFRSAAEASRWLNEQRGAPGSKAGRGNISSACRGELKTAYGYKWTFKD